METPRSIVLVITDGQELGRSVQRVIGAHLGNLEAVFGFTYAESLALLTPDRVEETDLFILELFRRYAGGLRAEGVALAERWGRRKPFLVISPLHLANELGCPGYWDTASADSLGQRVEQIVNFPRQCIEGFEKVVRCFGVMLRLPPQH